MNSKNENTNKVYSKEQVKEIIKIKQMTNNKFTDEQIYKKMIQYKKDYKSIFFWALKEDKWIEPKSKTKLEKEGDKEQKKGKNVNIIKKNRKENYCENDNQVFLTNLELCIKNIDYNATENELKSFLSQYGKVIFCKILRDENHKSKGIGFVTLSNYNSMKIMSIISGRFKEGIYFKERKLKIELARNDGMNKKPLILYYVLNKSSSCCVFESINNKDIIYLIYNVNYFSSSSIKALNIVDDEKILEIKNAHDSKIINLMHYADKVNKKDLLVSIDALNRIKVWDVSTWECLCYFSENGKYGNRNVMFTGRAFLFFSLINDNNNYYFMWKRLFYNPIIEVSDIEGNVVKEITDIEINENGHIAGFLYYDNKLNKNYIVSGHIGFLQSIDFTENKIYHAYYDNGYKEKFVILNVEENNGISKLMAFSDEGVLKIWNFHTGSLLNNIKLYDNSLVLKAFLKDDNNLFLLQHNVLKSVNLNNGRMEFLLKNIVPKNMNLVVMKKINHPKLGECFICQIQRK
jgi:hypothetical protein